MKSIHLFLSDSSFSQPSTIVSFTSLIGSSLPPYLQFLLYLSFIITFFLFYLFFFEMPRVFTAENPGDLLVARNRNKIWNIHLQLTGNSVTEDCNQNQFYAISENLFTEWDQYKLFQKSESLKMSKPEINAYEVISFFFHYIILIYKKRMKLKILLFFFQYFVTYGH